MRFSTGGMSLFGKARRSKFGFGSGLILLFIGTVFIGVSFIIFNGEIRSRDWPTAQAKVVHVAQRLDSENGMMYTPTVEYTVNGTPHRITSQMSSSSPETVGSTKTVRYNPNNQSEGIIAMSGMMYTFLLFPLIGAGLILGSIVAAVRSFKRSRVISNLKQSGIKVQGIVSNVESTSQRGSVRLTVSAPDQSGQVRSFASDTVSGNTFTLTDYQQKPIAMDVYIDATNPDIYYVDIDDIPEMTADTITHLLQKATTQHPFGNAATTSVVTPQPPSQVTIPTPMIAATPVVPPVPTIPPVGTVDTTVPPAQNYR